VSRAEDLTGPEFVTRLERLARLARKVLAGEFTGSPVRVARRPGSRFREHRPYAPGDDPRHIDWNVFGRLGEPYVKLFEAEEGGFLVVVLDVSRSMGVGDPPPFDGALRVAAALGYVALTVRGGGVILAAGSSPLVEFRGAGEEHRWLRHLSALDLAGDGPNAEAAARAMTVLGRPLGAAVLTDGEDPADLERTLAVLPRGRTLCVQILAREDLHPRLDGEIRLQSPEGGSDLSLHPVAALVDRYRALVRQRLAEAEGRARRREAAFLRAFSEEPFEGILLGMLRRGLPPFRS